MARHKACCALVSPRTLRYAALAAIAILLLPVGRAGAQKYNVIDPTIPEAAWKANVGKINGALRAADAPTPEVITAIEDGFLKYYYPSMTQYTPDALGALSENRKKLFTGFINVKDGNQKVREKIIEVTMKAMAPISVGNFHPAVRYNAAIILGQLDSTPGGTGAGATPPVPLAAGTNALIALLERDDIKGVPVPASIKIAALVGLERHTRFGVDPQFAEKLTAAALAVANRKAPPDDISADVNSWMRILAARVLANQFAKGFTAPVHQAFVGMIGGKEMGIDDRCKVAEMIAAPMYKGGKGVDAGELAAALGELAKATLADERKKAEEYIDAMTSGAAAGGFTLGRGGDGGGRFGGGGYGGRGGEGGTAIANPMEDTGPHFDRRLPLDRIMALHACANSLADGGSDDVKARMTSLAKALKEAADTLANAKTQEATASDLVVTLSGTVNTMVEAWAAGGAAAGVGAGGADAGGAAGAGAADAGGTGFGN